MSDKQIKCKTCGKVYTESQKTFITFKGTISVNVGDGKIRRLDFPNGIHFCKWSDCFLKFLTKKKLGKMPEAEKPKGKDKMYDGAMGEFI